MKKSAVSFEFSGCLVVKPGMSRMETFHVEELDCAIVSADIIAGGSAAHRFKANIVRILVIEDEEIIVSDERWGGETSGDIGEGLLLW